MTTAQSATRLERKVRSRRLWYHDIEVVDGLRTRYAQDYQLNPVLKQVDASNLDFLWRLAEHVGQDLSGKSVLDLGCADGLFAVETLRRGARRVVGIERNRHNYEHALWLKNTLALDALELQWNSVERAMPDETFDIVLFAGLIYHLVDPLGTLHLARTRCTHALAITSAVELPDGDGTAQARLDRYASGAHGMWSYNVPMLRQMLATAGFDIHHESVEQKAGGRHYFAIARPGNFSDHHVFEDRIDQEFPINIDRRRERVRAMWQSLSKQSLSPIAIFGAGTHTPWLLAQVADIPGVEVSCVLDDRPPTDGMLAGLPARRPTDINTEDIAAIVLSSWHQIHTLRARAEALFGQHVTILSPEA